MAHTKRQSLFLSSLALSLAFSGCKNIDLYDYDIPSELYFSESQHFDFSTTHTVALDLNYGPGIGAKALVQIYDQLPDDEYSVLPLYQTVTDEEGRIQCDVKLPTCVEEVWLVNHRFGMPENVRCSIESNTIHYVYEHAIAKDETRGSVRGSIDNTDYSKYVQVLDANRKIYSIVSWDDRFGNVANHPLVTTDTELAGSSYTTYVQNLQQTLWGGKTTKPSGLNNSQYALGGDIVNTKVLDSFIKDNGELAIVESATLNLVFMSEGAWNQNVLGYYYYPTGHAPAKASDVKKFVCLPNASKPGHHPYPSQNSTTYYKSNEAPAYAGESVSLLFENPDGTFTKNFPAGYTIGYFVISDGFSVGSTKGSIKTGGTTFYSNEEWNNGKKRYIALSLPNGAIVYGLEDGEGDKSYEDNLFIITGSPNEAIQNDEIPSIDPETKEIFNWEHTSAVYAFEDMWPNGGDYDLNDVVVCHKRGIYFESNTLKVSTVEDQFTLTTRSASYTNGFAIQYNKNLISSITIKDNKDQDITSQVRHYSDPENDGNETYIIFDNIQKLHNGDHFTVTRTFRNQIKKSTFESMEQSINPFIISSFRESDYEAGTMVEIHIPNYGKRTCKATSAGSTGDTYFYIERKGNNYYPFAISLPWVEFSPSEEAVCIDISYPQFNGWATSLGQYSKDWYKYPSKK